MNLQLMSNLIWGVLCDELPLPPNRLECKRTSPTVFHVLAGDPDDGDGRQVYVIEVSEHLR